jgi:threonine dehydrogenase-like Zn-dependent dehydrogenase
MLFSIALLIVIFFLSYKAAPRERAEHALVHGTGQIGLLAAVALFGMDYFTSFFYLEFRQTEISRQQVGLTFAL